MTLVIAQLKTFPSSMKILSSPVVSFSIISAL